MSPPGEAGLAERISDEIGRIHIASYGHEALSVKTHVLDDLIVCVIDIGLLPHERTLLDHGRREDLVRRVRSEYQEAIGSTFIATIEHFTGRRVAGFLSDTHIDPDFSVEIFRLAPPAAGEPEPETER